MKPLRIRIWMVIGMLIVFIVPRLFFEISEILERYIENAGRYELQSSFDRVMQEVGEVDVTHWRDPQWQDVISKKIDGSQLGILLLDASDHEIYRYAAAESEAVDADRQISMMEHGQLQGTAYFYVPKQGNGFGFIFSIIAGAGVILFIAWQMGRVVVKPLEAMSMAARQIADGNLDFHLPPSTVLEVANVVSGSAASTGVAPCSRSLYRNCHRISAISERESNSTTICSTGSGAVHCSG